MSWIIAFFCTFRWIFYLNVRISYLDRKINAIVAKREASEAALTARESQLERLNANFLKRNAKTLETFARQYTAADAELKSARKVNAKLEEALEATREQLRTAENITIPGLVAAHETVLSTYEAQTAVNVMRTAVKPMGDNE